MTSFYNQRKKIAADMQVTPVESVNISLESWGVTLEFVRGTLLNQILPVLDFKCLVNPKTWKVENLRCPLCRLGIIRCNVVDHDMNDPESLTALLSNYCVTCSVRCVLYNKIRRCIPRAQKQKLAKNWPVYIPPEYFPLVRGVREAKIHSLSHDNLTRLNSSEFSAPPSPNTSKYVAYNKKSAPSLQSPPRSPSMLGRTEYLNYSSSLLARNNSPLNRTRTSSRNKAQSPPRKSSPTTRVVAKMLKRDEDSDDEDNNDSVCSSKSKISSLFLSKTNSSPKKGASGTLKSKTVPNMPSFMRNFSSTLLSKDNVYEVVEPEPEPVPDMNLETRYGPQELALVPFLIAKGQYDEAERLLRVAMCLEDMLGEAGAVHTVTILLLQADMYMLLDIFPLALGLYLDCVDIIASSIGFEDEKFIRCVLKVISCARKMGFSQEYINIYVSQTCENLERSMIASKQLMVNGITRMDVRSERNQAEMDMIFIQCREYDSSLHSGTDFRQLVSSMRGLISFINILESPNGLAAATRVMFVRYCCNISYTPHSAKTSDGPKTYGPVAQFIQSCCRIRACQDSEVHRFLVQNLVHKYLSKHDNVIGGLVPDCDAIIQNIRAHVYEKMEKKGKAVKIEEFDPLLKQCVLFLYSEKIYNNFLASSNKISNFVIGDFMEAEAESVYVSAIIIQSFWRQKYVSWQVKRKRANLKILNTLEQTGSFVIESANATITS